MFKGCEKIYKAVLYTTKDYPKDISYRGQGLSNEYRLSIASGLIGQSEATSFTRVFNSLERDI